MKYQRAAFSHIDGLANESLSRRSFARYVLYRESLVASGEDASCIRTLLSQFVWDLYERAPGTTVH